jgi:hypothetical protein
VLGVRARRWTGGAVHPELGYYMRPVALIVCQIAVAAAVKRIRTAIRAAQSSSPRQGRDILQPSPPARESVLLLVLDSVEQRRTPVTGTGKRGAPRAETADDQRARQPMDAQHGCPACQL